VTGFETDDGRMLTYERRGSGPTLVCHPGGPGFSSAYFAGDLGGLDADFTLVLLDPRGTAGSTPPADATAYATADYVDDLEALRVHLGEERLDVLGHSHGGVVAAAFAARHPERMRRLILANSLARLQPEEMERLMQLHSDAEWYAAARAGLDSDDVSDDIWPMYFAHWNDAARRYVAAALTERANRDASKAFGGALETFDMRADLAGVSAPTLVITGERDFICGPACAADLAEIPGAKTVIVEDAGHFLFVEAPQRWRDEVTAFLR